MIVRLPISGCDVLRAAEGWSYTAWPAGGQPYLQGTLLHADWHNLHCQNIYGVQRKLVLILMLKFSGLFSGMTQPSLHTHCTFSSGSFCRTWSSPPATTTTTLCLKTSSIRYRWETPIFQSLQQDKPSSTSVWCQTPIIDTIRLVFVKGLHPLFGLET